MGEQASINCMRELSYAADLNKDILRVNMDSVSNTAQLPGAAGVVRLHACFRVSDCVCVVGSDRACSDLRFDFVASSALSDFGWASVVGFFQLGAPATKHPRSSQEGHLSSDAIRERRKLTFRIRLHHVFA